MGLGVVVEVSAGAALWQEHLLVVLMVAGEVVVVVFAPVIGGCDSGRQTSVSMENTEINTLV